MIHVTAITSVAINKNSSEKYNELLVHKGAIYPAGRILIESTTRKFKR